MAKTKAPERIRLNLEVTPPIKERIDRLQAESGAPTMIEVFRRALAVYEELLAVQKEGGRLIIENGDVRERLRFI